MDQTAVLLNGAKKSIRIMTVISSHGSYSAWDKWLQVKQAIERQGAMRETTKSNFVIELITSTEGMFKETFKEIHPLFKDEKNWISWKTLEEVQHEKRLSRFLDRASFEKGVEELTVPDYFEARYLEHMDTIRELSKLCRCEVYCCKLPVPIYCWLVDDAKAIFSMPTQSADGAYAGAAIQTDDPEVVATLVSMLKHYKAIAEQ